MRNDEKMLAAWQTCVDFNNKWKARNVFHVKEEESSKMVEIIVIGQAYVINDTPMISTTKRQYRLSQIVQE